jgi:single-stranded-DNA-specific exonuclease
MAERLSAMNSERRDLQATMVEQAEASVQKWILRHGTDTLPVGVVLFEADWHHGVVGLVASKLKEALHRPVIACAPAEIEKCGDGSPLGDLRDQDDRKSIVKASGRSIPGFHLRDALAEIDVAHPGLLLRFGGHAMAAGLSLRRDDIDTFSAAFDRIARTRIPAEQLDAVLLTDGELGSDDFSLDLAQRLHDAGPWGQTFPEPLFDGVFEVASWRVMGETHLRLQLRHEGIALPLGAVMFNGYRGTPVPQRIRAAYQLTVDDWNDRESLRLLLRHIEPA